MRKILYTYSAVLAVAFLLVIVSTSLYCLLTASGARQAAVFVFSKYAKFRSISIGPSNGSLLAQAIYTDVVLRDTDWLPSDSTLSIQKLTAAFRPFASEKIGIEIFNAKLQISSLEPILFYGVYQNNALEASVYSKRIVLKELLNISEKADFLDKFAGAVSNLDISVQGALTAPRITGTLYAEKIAHDGFSITSAPASFDITCGTCQNAPQPKGTLWIKEGIVSGPKTAVIKLSESKIIFSGDIHKPAYDIKGTATVEGTKISIVLKGTADAPDLRLTSEPSLPQNQLMIMLATAKSWKGTETALIQKTLSPAVMRDFIDYFVFAGKGAQFAEQLGIKDIMVKFDKQSQGIGVKKTISQNVDAIYDIEQSRNGAAPPTTTQKVGGEYSVTKNLSVGAERELKQEEKQAAVEGDQKQKPKDTLYLKYKQTF